MAAPQNFRSAFNGFNREDVVNYISYTTSRHETEVNQLRSEADTLRRDLEQLQQQSAAQEELQQENEEQKRQISALQQEVEQSRSLHEQLQEQLSEQQQEAQALRRELEQLRAAAAAEKKPEPDPRWNEELNAYRRAERTERLARERVGHMYDRASAALAEASGKIGGSAEELAQLAGLVQSNLEAFERAIGQSGQILTDAAAALGSIRPEEE